MTQPPSQTLSPVQVMERVCAILDGVSFEFGPQRELHALKVQVLKEAALAAQEASPQQDARLCSGCDASQQQCNEWKQQGKACCPDCKHRPSGRCTACANTPLPCLVSHSGKPVEEASPHPEAALVNEDAGHWRVELFFQTEADARAYLAARRQEPP